MSLIITDSFSKSYEDAKSIFDFSAHDSMGNIVNLKEKYFGKVCLILNATVKGKEVKGILRNLRHIKNSFKDKGNEFINYFDICLEMYGVDKKLLILVYKLKLRSYYDLKRKNNFLLITIRYLMKYLFWPKKN